MTTNKLKLIFASVLFLVAYTSISHAQTDAYSAEVAVADRSAPEQQAAYMAALRRVLLENSGDKTLLNRDNVRSGLKQAENFVKSFSYRTPPPGTIISSDTPITDLVRDTGQATQLMMVSFDRQLVRDLIDSTSSKSAANKAEQTDSVVAFRKDSALVWLLIQDDTRDILISDPAAVNVQNRAREIAGASGLSLVFPTGDEEDLQAVPVDVLLQQDIERIRLASLRYDRDVILVGTLTRNGASGWSGQWQRLLGNEQQQYDIETPSLDAALQEGLSLLNSLSGGDDSYQYGGNALSDTEALLWVGSIDSTADYADVMNFLESQASVSTVYPKEISDTAMVFAVLPRSALADIEAALFNLPWLRRSAPPTTTVSGSLGRNADLALEYAR
ncbi:MAG: DUF2066 domain-containing protein [Granulosicoccus sp.]